MSGTNGSAGTDRMVPVRWLWSEGSQGNATDAFVSTVELLLANDIEMNHSIDRSLFTIHMD